MAQTIYKYALEISRGVQRILMPQQAHVLVVQMQHDELTLWVLVKKGGPMAHRAFEVFGTGWVVPEDVVPGDHLGTVQHEGCAGTCLPDEHRDLPEG